MESCLSLHEVIAQLSTHGAPVPTGFPPIDRQCRGGGIPPGRVVVIGGPPESGKTTLLCQILNHLSAQGYPVLALFKDEGRDQAAVRLGQQLGYKREELETGKPDLVTEMASRMDGITFKLMDPDEAGSTLEGAVEALNAISPPLGVVRILATDSIQTIAANATPPSSEREAIVQFMDTARRLARAHNLIIFVTSQVSRGFYQAKKLEDRTEAAAAFLGSSRIEFAGDFALVIHPTNPEGVSRAQVTKNRLRTGHSHDFFVRVDLPSAKVLEVEKADPEGIDEHTGNQIDAEHRILVALGKHGGLQARDLREAAGGRTKDHLDARDRLIAQNKIFQDFSGGKRAVYRLSMGTA